MSDFIKELEGKAYALVSGTMELDEFKSWYQLAQAAKAGTVAIQAEPQQAVSIPVRTFRPAVVADEPEDDYRPCEPTLDSPNTTDPEWAVGTGDRKQWPPG
jgi:hypothetical protein